MSEGRIVSEIDAVGVASIVLDRPAKKNALTDAMFDQLAETVAGLRAAHEAGRVRVLLLTGAGDAFCAGGDVDEMLELTRSAPPRAELERRARRASEIAAAIATFPSPTIAQVQGPAVGGGACLAIACDVVYARPDARIAFPFVRLGTPGGDMLAPWLLARRVGTRAALRVLLDGNTMSGEEAHRLGIVDELATDVAEAARSRAAAWASGPRRALAVTKATVSRLELADEARQEQLEFEIAAGADALEGPEMREGLTALRERRAPDFSRM